MKKSTAIRVAAIVLGVIVIPLLYSLLYLSAFNDPYSKLSTLPIAVVNQDKGATIDGTKRNIGNELVDKLKDNNQLGWHFTDEEDAKSGVKDTKYYAVITIPENFSQDIASADDTTKTASTITYTMNEKRNYIGGQIISRAMLTLQQEVVSDVNKELTVELTKKFDEVPDKMNDLNDGLGELQDGTQQVADGLSTLKDKSVTLVNGVSSLDKGMAAIASGSGTLSSGLSEYKTKFDGMVAQESQLYSAANEKLPQLVAGIGSVNQGVGSIAQGTDSLNQGLSTLAPGTSSLAAGMNALDLNLNTYVQGMANLSQGANTLRLGNGNLASGANTLNQGMTSLDQAIAKSFLGSQTLSNGMTQYSNQFGKFASGQKALALSVDKNLPVLINGIQKFNTSVNDIMLIDPKTNQPYTTNLADITSQYVDGVSTLQTSYATLLAGLQDCAQTKDPVQFQQKFAVIMQNIQNNQAVMQAQSKQLQEAGQQIKQGTKDVCDGAGNLNTSVEQLQSLQSSIDQLENATEQLKVATEGMQTGSGNLADALSQIKEGADALKAGSDALKTGADTAEAGADSVNNGANSLKDGADKIKAGVDKLKTGADSVNSGTDALKTGSETLKSGTDKLKSGTNDLNSQSQALTTGDSNMVGSINKLTDALNQFQQAVDKLNSGSQTLNSGIQQEQDGMDQLNGQTPALQSGVNDLSDGANQVNDGAKTAKDGVQSSVDDTNSQLDKLNGLDDYSANPVSLNEEKTEAVPNYGTAFAPYFMSLSLWVGALIMFFGIYLDPDKRMPLLSRSSDRKLVRIAGFSAIGLAQAVFLAALVQWILNLQINNIGAYYLSCILISMVFISMVQFFIVHLGDIGKLLGIVMLILQLTSCGGTFPMETVPKLFNVLYPYMPMTYSVNILKESISGNSLSIIMHNALILIAIGVAFTILTIIFSIIKKTTNTDNKNNSVAA